jgi:hypothetical protein
MADAVNAIARFWQDAWLDFVKIMEIYGVCSRCPMATMAFIPLKQAGGSTIFNMFATEISPKNLLKIIKMFVPARAITILGRQHDGWYIFMARGYLYETHISFYVCLCWGALGPV